MIQRRPELLSFGDSFRTQQGHTVLSTVHRTRLGTSAPRELLTTRRISRARAAMITLPLVEDPSGRFVQAASVVTPPVEMWHRCGFAHQLVEAQETMTIVSGRSALQDSSGERKHRIPLHLQPTPPGIDSVHSLPKECPHRFWHVWEKQWAPCLELTSTLRS